MSRQQESSGSAGSAAAGSGLGLTHAAAPRLTDGGYAEWRPRMEAYFMRMGVQGVHTREMEKDTWEKLCAQVLAWDNEQEQADIARAMGAKDIKLESLDQEEKNMRKRVRDMLQRSEKAYAALFEVMPGELQRQVAHIPTG